MNSVNQKLLEALYEEGKDCLHGLSILPEERGEYDRVFEILKELRDISVKLNKSNAALESSNDLREVLNLLQDSIDEADKHGSYPIHTLKTCWNKVSDFITMQEEAISEAEQPAPSTGSGCYSDGIISLD